MPDDRVRFTLRLPKELHERLEWAAKNRDLSRNKLIEGVLDAHLLPLEMTHDRS